jgi:hypothetical protein
MIAARNPTTLLACRLHVALSVWLALLLSQLPLLQLLFHLWWKWFDAYISITIIIIYHLHSSVMFVTCLLVSLFQEYLVLLFHTHMWYSWALLVCTLQHTVHLIQFAVYKNICCLHTVSPTMATIYWKEYRNFLSLLLSSRLTGENLKMWAQLYFDKC